MYYRKNCRIKRNDKSTKTNFIIALSDHTNCSTNVAIFDYLPLPNPPFQFVSVQQEQPLHQRMVIIQLKLSILKQAQWNRYDNSSSTRRTSFPSHLHPDFARTSTNPLDGQISSHRFELCGFWMFRVSSQDMEYCIETMCKNGYPTTCHHIRRLPPEWRDSGNRVWKCHLFMGLSGLQVCIVVWLIDIYASSAFSEKMSHKWP